MIARRRDPAYCFGVMGRAKAPWRPTHYQAMADAVDAGYGWFSEHAGPPGKDRRIYLHALAEIWTTIELVPALPREVVQPTSAAPAEPLEEMTGLSRIDRIIARREGRLR